MKSLFKYSIQNLEEVKKLSAVELIADWDKYKHSSPAELQVIAPLLIPAMAVKLKQLAHLELQ